MAIGADIFEGVLKRSSPWIRSGARIVSDNICVGSGKVIITDPKEHCPYPTQRLDRSFGSGILALAFIMPLILAYHAAKLGRKVIREKRQRSNGHSEETK